MLASLHVSLREVEIAYPRCNRRSNGEQNVSAWIFLTFGEQGLKKRYKDANKSDKLALARETCATKEKRNFITLNCGCVMTLTIINQDYFPQFGKIQKK